MWYPFQFYNTSNGFIHLLLLCVFQKQIKPKKKNCVVPFANTPHKHTHTQHIWKAERLRHGYINNELYFITAETEHNTVSIYKFNENSNETLLSAHQILTFPGIRPADITFFKVIFFLFFFWVSTFFFSWNDKKTPTN